MPFGEAHKRQKRKNWVLFLILLAFVALFYTITVLRITGAMATAS